MASFRPIGLYGRQRRPVARRGRSLAARLPERTRGPLELALGAFAGLLIGYAIVRKGPATALVLTLAIPCAAVLLRRAANSVALGAGIVAVVPYWWTIGSQQLSIPRAALLVSAAGVVIGAGRRTRIRLPDLALAGLALLFVASFDPGLGVPRGLLIEAIVSISFYAIGRLVGTADTTRLILWALAAGGAVGGLSVMFEFFVTQSPLVSDSSQYGWQQDATYIYRPGGLYGSPPGAVAALSMSTVCALPLIAGERHWRRVFAIGLALLGLAGIILTFTRAGWIGFVVGALLYAVLSADQFKRRAKALLVTAVMLGVAALLVLPSVSGSDLYQKGVDRGGTLQAREGYWQLALPLVADSPKHLFLGRGFSALLSGDSGGNIDSGLMTAPQVTISGTHNQYVKTLVEHGLLGLALFLTWLVGSIAIAARNARIAKGEARRLSAALAGATLSFAIVSLAGDTFRDAQTIAMVSLLAGLGVTLGARSRKSAR